MELKERPRPSARRLLGVLLKEKKRTSSSYYYHHNYHTHNCPRTTRRYGTAGAGGLVVLGRSVFSRVGGGGDDDCERTRCRELCDSKGRSANWPAQNFCNGCRNEVSPRGTQTVRDPTSPTAPSHEKCSTAWAVTPSCSSLRADWEM